MSIINPEYFTEREKAMNQKGGGVTKKKTKKMQPEVGPDPSVVFTQSLLGEIVDDVANGFYHPQVDIDSGFHEIEESATHSTTKRKVT